MEENKMKNGTNKILRIIPAVFVFVLWSFNVNAQNVTQKLGILDVEFTGLNKELCQGCHGESLVSDHHNTAKAKAGDCIACHGVQGKNGIVLTRNCMDCHKKSPHHQTKAAANKECTSCHDSPGLSDFSKETASYPVSSVTPQVSSCRKCHNKGTYEGLPIVSPKETHHGIAVADCSVCHDATDQTKTDIRICGRCHSASAIHKVPAHVTAESCVVCHTMKQP